MNRYEIIKTDTSRCSNCEEYLYLLCTVAAQPSFYICWKCNKVYQIGFGEVRKMGKCGCGGYHNDWHSHASDCIEINEKGKKYGV